MCKCKQLTKVQTRGELGWFDYTFECVDDNDKKYTQKIKHTSDGNAKMDAEEKCKERSGI